MMFAKLDARNDNLIYADSLNRIPVNNVLPLQNLNNPSSITESIYLFLNGLMNDSVDTLFNANDINKYNTGLKGRLTNVKGTPANWSGYHPVLTLEDDEYMNL
jgi:hypothetical protein